MDLNRPLLVKWLHASKLNVSFLSIITDGKRHPELILLSLARKLTTTLFNTMESTKWQPESLSRSESGRFGALKSDSTHHFFRNVCTKSGSLRFSVFRLLTDFVCLYNNEFWLSLCKIVRSSVILLLPLFTMFCVMSHACYGLLYMRYPQCIISRSMISHALSAMHYAIHCCTCFLSHVKCFLYLIVHDFVWLALCTIHFVPPKTEGLCT